MACAEIIALYKNDLSLFDFILSFFPPAENCTRCNNGDLHLTQSDSEHMGHVEVCFNCQWGSICDDSWTNIDARTVCGLLGFETTGQFLSVNSS